MLVTPLSTLSADGSLHLQCPKSWREMTQDQLRYTLHVIGCGMYNSAEARTLLLLRFTGIEVNRQTSKGWSCSIKVAGRRRKFHFLLQDWQVQDMIGQLAYVGSYETMDVRLESIQGFKAVDGLLHGVSFRDYLEMEKYYQGFIATKEYKYALGLAQQLYPGGVTAIDDAEIMGCTMWYAYVKKVMAEAFRSFFQPFGGTSGAKAPNWLEQFNAQVRALTGGDITKEAAVFAKDCWRALTELDAKAREVKEFKQKYPKK